MLYPSIGPGPNLLQVHPPPLQFIREDMRRIDVGAKSAEDGPRVEFVVKYASIEVGVGIKGQRLADTAACQE